MNVARSYAPFKTSPRPPRFIKRAYSSTFTTQSTQNGHMSISVHAYTQGHKLPSCRTRDLAYSCTGWPVFRRLGQGRMRPIVYTACCAAALTAVNPTLPFPSRISICVPLERHRVSPIQSIRQYTDYNARYSFSVKFLARSFRLLCIRNTL